MKIHEAQMNGMKIEIVSSTIIVQNFDTLVPVMDIPIRQKISKEICGHYQCDLHGGFVHAALHGNFFCGLYFFLKRLCGL